MTCSRVTFAFLFVPILSQINPVHFPLSYIQRSILIVLSYLRQNFQIVSFHSGFPLKTLSVPLFSLIRAACLNVSFFLICSPELYHVLNLRIVCYCSWRCVGYICLLISYYLPTAICCLIILVYLTMLVRFRRPLSWTAVHSENDEFELCGRKRSCHF